MKTGEKTRNIFKEVNAAMATNMNDNADNPMSTSLCFEIEYNDKIYDVTILMILIVSISFFPFIVFCYLNYECYSIVIDKF